MQGVLWNQKNDTLYHSDTGQMLMELYNFNGVPAIQGARPNTNNKHPVTVALAVVPYMKMHSRLLHASKGVITEACRRAGIALTHKGDDFCEGCVRGKMTDELGKEAPIQAEQPLDFIRVDVVSHSPPAMLGYRSSVHIIDVHSNYHWVNFARSKKEILSERSRLDGCIQRTLVVDWCQHRNPSSLHT
ncbi:hypothetical protein N657DRAFT_255987 [Parathielavia appendiculata]|uniref:GAG-pre-integrase domain-containing protein n=1 Tax=Parathielavia appendiculata TaxID=2587402 RepID=A0AAN6TSF8_9PEZI|nr:hypothetical protein N657DRAFT_255987 [Parathielavia appendiculata]